MVMPTTNAYLSHRVAPDAQGELQGAVASLFSLGSIVGPPIMTQLFGRFAAADAPLRLPGAPFIASAVLSAGCFVVYGLMTREPVPAGAATGMTPAP
jgi:DHA1 family tetracycline resistance protein-like MFS transporter